MPVYLFLLQIVVPAWLLIWLSILPPAGRIGRSVQMGSTAIALLTLSLVTPWALPPFWVPWLYWVVWAALSWRAMRRPPRRTTPLGWVAILPVIGLALYGLTMLPAAIAGRRVPPDQRVVDLALPFGPGRYFSVNGGTTQTLNGHMHVLSEPGSPDVGQAYAADLVGITALGLRSDGWQPADPARYLAFGRDILAPCAGTITTVHDGRPDMPVPEADPEHPAGNHLSIVCDEVTIVMAHVREGSIVVAPGEDVATGDVLGQIGNSGNTTEPHLHIHAEIERPEGAAIPLAIRFDGRIPFRNSRFTVAEAR